VEQKYTKDQILELYLNQVYLANGVYGIGTAAEYYFGEAGVDSSALAQGRHAGRASSSCPDLLRPLAGTPARRASSATTS
jgi:hypothetical protein